MTHPVAWFVWIAAAALVPLLARNPLYLILVFAANYVVADVVREQDPQPASTTLISPLRFALFAVPVGALFNGLTSHVGETVLLRLPALIPLVGGAITVEALVFGAVNGLVLATLFSAFAVLTLAVPVRDLIGYLPRAFYPVAVVSAIAVTFVPNTLRQFRQVREAQSVRGHRMRGLRDWLPLFMPVLIGGLERALQLAEAMTARGFAARAAAPSSGDAAPLIPVAPERASAVSQVASVGGLVSVLVGGILRLVSGASPWASLFVLGGTVLVTGAIWWAGRGIHHTRYRRPKWTVRDSLMVAGSVVAIIPLIVWASARDYTPYPLVSLPSFDARVGVALLGLIAPAVVAWRKEDDGDHSI
jgi:energy-coupling factor transport system permease protein